MRQLRVNSYSSVFVRLLNLLLLFVFIDTWIHAKFSFAKECPNTEEEIIEDEISVPKKYKPTQNFDQGPFETCYGFAATYMLEYFYNQQKDKRRPIGISPFSVLGNACPKNIQKLGGIPYKVLYQLQEDRKNKLSRTKDMPYNKIMGLLRPEKNHWIDCQSEEEVKSVLSSLGLIEDTFDIASHIEGSSNHFDIIDKIHHRKITIPPYNIHILENFDKKAPGELVRKHFQGPNKDSPLNLNTDEHSVVITGVRKNCCKNECHEEWNISNSYGKGIQDGWRKASEFTKITHFSYIAPCGKKEYPPCTYDISGAYSAHYMAAIASVSRFEEFLTKHPDSLKEKKKSGETLAHGVAKYGKLDILQYLAEHHPDLLKEKDRWGRTVSHTAAKYGKLNIIQYLTEHHPDLLKERDNSGRTLAHWAAHEGHLNIIQYLAEHHPDLLKEKNTHGRTPARVARGNGKSNIVQYLKDHHPELLE